MVALVDGETKSAAEAFIGALAFHRRAVIVGPPTFGKTTIECASPGLDGDRRLEKCGHFELPTSNGVTIL